MHVIVTFQSHVFGTRPRIPGGTSTLLPDSDLTRYWWVMVDLDDLENVQQGTSVLDASPQYAYRKVQFKSAIQSMAGHDAHQ